MAAIDLDRVSSIYREMRDEALETLRSENVDPKNIDLIFTADLRYIGQFDEIEVPISFDGQLLSENIAELIADFERKHESLNGYTMPGEPTELINVGLTAYGRTTKPALLEEESAGPDPSQAHLGTREAIFSGKSIQADIYAGLELRRDNRIVGPAIIEQPTTTIVLIEGYNMTVDGEGNDVKEAAKKSRKDEQVTQTILDSQKTNTDPILVAVIGNALDGITKEIGETMLRTSRSPIFVEARDFATSIFSADCRLLAQTHYIPVIGGATP